MFKKLKHKIIGCNRKHIDTKNVKETWRVTLHLKTYECPDCGNQETYRTFSIDSKDQFL